MTFRIGERELGVVGVIVVLPLIVMVALKIAECGMRNAE
jgi:hypothetical protein